jgi:tetratricopeptide (TPR) repeat protein
MARRPTRQAGAGVTRRGVATIVAEALARSANREVQAMAVLTEAFKSNQLEMKHRLLVAAREVCPEKSETAALIEDAIRYLADEYVYQAWDAVERTQYAESVRMARAALEIWPDCAEAYLFLAENSKVSNEEKIRLLERALETGERTAADLPDLDRLEGEQGPHARYYHTTHPDAETHPALRARFNLALALREAGNNERAYDLLYELFDVDPDDRLTARYELIRFHVLDGEFGEARELLDLYNDPESVEWLYTDALVGFAEKGADAAATKSLRSAITRNPHVAVYLLGLEDVPRYTPLFFTDNDEYGAVNYVYLYAEAWESIDGVLEFLRGHYGGAVH